MPFVIACDFDDTIFSGYKDDKLNPKMDVIDKIKEFQDSGAEIALWTCREGKLLEEAVDASKEVGLEFDSHNDNTPSTKAFLKQVLKDEDKELATNKIMADFYLDDKAYNIEFFLQINVKEN